MRFLPSALALALLLPAAGCRDTVVGPLPQDTPPSTASPSESADFYVKGPDTMVRGQRSQFRTEPKPESASFSLVR